MSNLSIGLVTLPSEETNQLISFLEKLGVQIVYNIAPDEVQDFHIENEELNVWLLNVDDGHWHDNIDRLLDESDASIYFNEPETLSKQSHAEYWCQNLVNRLYELTGLTDSLELQAGTEASLEGSDVKNDSSDDQIEITSMDVDNEVEEKVSFSAVDSIEESIEAGDQLTSALDELESNSIGLPSDIAAELVSELEDISPDLNTYVEESLSLTDEPKEAETIEISAPIDTSLDVDSNIVNEELSVDEDLSFDEEISDIALDETELDQMLEISELTEDLEKFEAFEETTDDLSLDEFVQDDFLQENESDKLDSESHESTLLEITEPSSQADITIAELGEVPYSHDSVSTEELGSNEIVESIDFSNSSIPMLESARDDIHADLHSIYEIEEEQSQALTDKEVQAETEPQVESNYETESKFENESKLEIESNKQNEIQMDSDFDLVSLEEADEIEIPILEHELEAEIVSDLELVSDDLSLDDGALEELISGKADFLKDLEPETVTDEAIGLSGDSDEIQLEEISLSLEEFEEEKLTGKAVFIEDEVQTEDGVIEESSEKNANNTESDFADLGLSLESIEEERPITGKAVFIDEDDEFYDSVEPNAEISDIDETETIEIEASISELSLELTESQRKSGRAIFIEEELEDLEAESVEESSSSDEEEINLPDEQEFGFEMEEMDSAESIKENLIEDVLPSQVSNNEAEELSESQYKEEINLGHLQLVEETSVLEEDIAFEADTAIEADIALKNDKEQEESSQEKVFEIPMLEDSAMELEFDELVEAPSKPQEKVPCWAIGASLGGPAAVKRFLQSLPADIKASFIITQHIDDSFLPVLAEILTTTSSFDVKVANGSNPMESGRVYLAPLKGKIVFLKDGSMLVDHSQKWSEPYSPCIDDVVSSLASVYGDKSGAIIFSGMGQDGLKGAKKMIQEGGQVWVQSLDTCANPSMPEAILNAELASVVDTPEKLAEKLAEHLNETNKLSNFGS